MSREVVKFAILVGLAVLFFDAVLAPDANVHWITKGFFVVAFFAIGTAYFGAGMAQGLFITLLYSLLFKVYQSYPVIFRAPIDTWWMVWAQETLTIYLTVLAGYMLALWILTRSSNRIYTHEVVHEKIRHSDSWGRRLLHKDRVRKETTLDMRPDPVNNMWFAVAGALAVLIIDIAVTYLFLLRTIPEWSLVLQNFVIIFVLLFAGRSYVGFDTWSTLVIAALMGMALTTYTFYSGYSNPWYHMVLGTFAATLLGIWAITRFMSSRHIDAGWVFVPAVIAVLLSGWIPRISPEFFTANHQILAWSVLLAISLAFWWLIERGPREPPRLWPMHLKML